MATAIFDIGSKSLNNKCKNNDSTFVSGSGGLYSDGTISVDVIVNGGRDTTTIRTKNKDETKRLQDDNVKWTKNKNQ